MRSVARVVRNYSMIVGILLALPVCGLGQNAPPKETQAKPYTLNVQARLVVLDVVVTDKSGKIRPNMKREDFKVWENGVPQTIVSFEAPSAHVAPTGVSINSTAELEAAAPRSSVNIIVLDEMNTKFEDMGYARYALKKYLSAHEDVARAPTTLLAVNADRLSVLHDYTQDRGAILSALSHHLAAYPWNLKRGEDKTVNFAKSLGTLEQVAMATAGHPGHKNVIWVGKGFAGIDLSSSAIPATTSEAITYAMQQAVNILRDSRVTLYLVDPAALSSTTATTVDQDSIPGMEDGSMDNSAPDPFAGSVSFGGLAVATGGRTFFSRNDVDQEFGESVRDGAAYYTIAYRPTDPSDEQKDYRKIRVSFTTPGLEASYRDGYYRTGAADATLMTPRVKYDLESAEVSTMVYTGLDVKAVAKPDTSGTYVVGVPQRELVWTPDGDKETSKIIVIIAGINKDGAVIRRNSATVIASRSATAVANEHSLARTEITLPDISNVQRLRFVVRGDGNGRIGTFDLPLPKK